MANLVVRSNDPFYQSYFPVLKSKGIVDSLVIQIIDDYCCYKPTGKELADRLKKINETNKGLCEYADYIQMVAFFGYPLRQLISKGGLENFHFVNVCLYYFETIARKNGYSDQFEKLLEIVHNIPETNDLVGKLPQITETLLVLKKVLVYAYELVNATIAHNNFQKRFFSEEFQEKRMSDSNQMYSIMSKTNNPEVFLFLRKFNHTGNVALSPEDLEAGPWLQKFPSYVNGIKELNELLNHIYNNNKSELKPFFKILLFQEICIRLRRLAFLLSIKSKNLKNLQKNEDVKRVLKSKIDTEILGKYSNDFLKAQIIFKWLENNSSIDLSKVSNLSAFVNEISILGSQKNEADLIYAIASSALDKRYYDKYSFSEFYNLQPEDLNNKEVESLFFKINNFKHKEYKESKGIDSSFNVTIKKKLSAPTAPKAKKNKKFDYAKEAKEPEPQPQPTSAATPSAKSKNQLKAILDASNINASLM